MDKEKWIFLKLDDLTQEFLQDNERFNDFCDKAYDEMNLE